MWGLPGHSSTNEFVNQAGLAGRNILSHSLEDVCVEVTDHLLRAPAADDAAVQDSVLIGMLDRLREILMKLRLTVCHADNYVVGVSCGG